MFKKNHLRITTYDQDHVINLAHISHVKYFAYNPRTPEDEGGKDERVEIVMAGVPEKIIIRRQGATIDFYRNLINKLQYFQI